MATLNPNPQPCPHYRNLMRHECSFCSRDDEVTARRERRIVRGDVANANHRLAMISDEAGVIGWSDPLRQLAAEQEAELARLRARLAELNRADRDGGQR